MSIPPSPGSASKRPADDDGAPAKRAGSATPPADAVETTAEAHGHRTLRAAVVEQCKNPCSWLHLVPRDMMRAMLIPLAPNDARGRLLGRVGTMDPHRHVVVSSPLAAVGRRSDFHFGLYEHDGTNVILSRASPDDDQDHLLFAPRTATVVQRMTRTGWPEAGDLPWVVTRYSNSPDLFYGTGTVPPSSGYAYKAMLVDIDNTVMTVELSFDFFELAAHPGLTWPHLVLARAASITRVSLPDLAARFGRGRNMRFPRDGTFVQAAMGADGTYYVALRGVYHISPGSEAEPAACYATGPEVEHTVCYAIRPGAVAPCRSWKLFHAPRNGILVDCADRILVHDYGHLDLYSADGLHLQSVRLPHNNIVKVVLLRDGTLVMLHAPDGVISIMPTA